MKIIPSGIILFFLCCFTRANAQQPVESSGIVPPPEYANVHVHKVAGDSLTTTFVIFIKEKVAMHKHEFHSENVIVLEGTAVMMLDGKRYEIKAGDIIFIPKNTWHEVNVTSSTPLKVLSIQAPMFDGTDRVIYKNQ